MREEVGVLETLYRVFGKILPESIVKNIFLTILANIVLVCCVYALTCTLAQNLLSEQKPMQLKGSGNILGTPCSYRMFIKYFRKFAPSPSPALGCYWLYKKLPASRSDCTLALR